MTTLETTAETPILSALLNPPPCEFYEKGCFILNKPEHLCKDNSNACPFKQRIPIYLNKPHTVSSIAS